MLIDLNTAVKPPGARMSFWKDIVCDVYVDLDCRSQEKEFFGTVNGVAAGEVSLTEVRSCPQRISRTSSRIARSTEDYLLFAFGVDGISGVLQDGREALVKPGDCVLYDSTRAYELVFEENIGQRILKVPRKAFTSRIGPVEHLTAIAFDARTPLRRFTYDVFCKLSQTLASLPEEVGAQLLDHALDVLATQLNQDAQAGEISLTTYRSAMLYRLKGYINSSLRNPKLSTDDAASVLGCSTRYVRMLLAAENTSFRHYVLEQRLENCRRDLAQPSKARMQVAEIAYAWGFNDAAYFSRAFKSRFDVAPSEIRMRAKRAPHDRREP